MFFPGHSTIVDVVIVVWGHQQRLNPEREGKKAQDFIARLKLLSDDKESFRGAQELGEFSVDLTPQKSKVESTSWRRKLDHVLPSIGGTMKQQRLSVGNF